MIRMMSGIGIPSSQRRIGIVLSFLQLFASRSNCASTNGVSPCTVSDAAAFPGCRGCRKGADEERQRKPDGCMHRDLTGFVEICLRLRDDVIDALLRVGLAQAGMGRYRFCEIVTINPVDVAVSAETRRQKAGEFAAGIGQRLLIGPALRT